MTLTLLGDVVSSLVLTIIAGGIGRRRKLGLGSLLMTASGIVFARCSSYWVLVAASELGVILPGVNAGPTSMGADSADIVAAERTSGPSKPLKS
jgi:predicted MFS family arabinose efflux permease